MPSQDFPSLSLSEETKRSLVEYLRSEIDNSIRARSTAVDMWKQILKLYEQVDIPEKGNIPFEGAANIMISVIATRVEQLHARLFGTIYAPDYQYNCQPTRPDLNKYAKALRRFCSWAGKNELNEKAVDYSAIMEMNKLGTQVQKCVYTRRQRTLHNYNDSLKKWEKTIETVSDHPEYIHVKISDFFWQMNARCKEESEWLAHRFRLTWNEVKYRVEHHGWDPKAADVAKSWRETHKTEVEEAVDEEAGLENRSINELEFYEVWVDYPLGAKDLPIDEDTNLDTEVTEIPSALVVTFHKEAREIMTVRYNTEPLGMDPFELCPYVGREQQILGIGVGQMAIATQIEVSTMHNQRLDNGTVVNSIGYKYLADGRVPSQLALRPGAGVAVDDMRDFEPFQLGQKFDSTVQDEVHTLQLLDERIGNRDVILDEAAMAKAPATTTLALLAEKGRRLDDVLENIRGLKARMMRKALLQYKRYYPLDKLLETFGEEDGTLLMEFFSLPDTTIWNSVGITVTATTAANSKEMGRQNKAALFNVIMGYQDKYASYIAIASNPQAPPPLRIMALKMAEGLSIFIEELLEDFGTQNRQDYILDTEQLAGLITATGAANPPEPVPDGGVPAAPPEGAPPRPQAVA